MSKIVCDVCGSSYSENEAQCPICGTARSEAVKPVVETTGEEQASKGGKFSKTNTKKTTPARPREQASNPGEKKQESNVAMIVIVAVLLLAIVAVCVFIAIRFIDKPDGPADSTTTSSSSVPSTSTNPDIPCTGIELVGNDTKSLSFTDLTQSAQLTVQALPADTTDNVILTYTSSDPSVVTVDANGKVTPVANGSATITVTYMEYTITVNVTCEVYTKLVLDVTDVTLNPSSSTAKLYSGRLDVTQITWTSSDESVATVKDGVVTAVGNGNATITAVYGDQTVTCKVHVKEMGKVSNYVLSSTWGEKDDATLAVGEKMEIWLVNKTTGEVVKGLSWTPSNDFPKCCTMETTEKGVSVTGTAVTSTVSGGYVYVRTTYEGETFTFKLRVKAASTQE